MIEAEFISHNSSVIHVMEHISFTLTGRINITATANFKHLTFHLSLNLHTYQLIKARTYEFVISTEINHQAETPFSNAYVEQNIINYIITAI